MSCSATERLFFLSETTSLFLLLSIITGIAKDNSSQACQQHHTRRPYKHVCCLQPERIGIGNGIDEDGRRRPQQESEQQQDYRKGCHAIGNPCHRHTIHHVFILVATAQAFYHAPDADGNGCHKQQKHEDKQHIREQRRIEARIVIEWAMISNGKERTENQHGQASQDIQDISGDTLRSPFPLLSEFHVRPPLSAFPAYIEPACPSRR